MMMATAAMKLIGRPVICDTSWAKCTNQPVSKPCCCSFELVRVSTHHNALSALFGAIALVETEQVEALPHMGRQRRGDIHHPLPDGWGKLMRRA